MNRIEAIIALEAEYKRAAQARKAAMARRAASYAALFEEAHAARLERRAADRRQWLDMILPHIKEEASLRRYERGLDTNSGAVPGHAAA